jgi:hypothetical protein
VLTESLDRNAGFFRANVETARGWVPDAVRKTARNGRQAGPLRPLPRQPICCMIDISFFA